MEWPRAEALLAGPRGRRLGYSAGPSAAHVRELPRSTTSGGFRYMTFSSACRAGGESASDVLEVDGQAFLDRARAAKMLKPRRDLRVVQIGIVATAGADDLEGV